MNKDKLIEKLEIALKIIRNDLAWQYKVPGAVMWSQATGMQSPSTFIPLDGYEIRVMLVQPDELMRLKQAHKSGKQMQFKLHEESDTRWTNLSNPSWDTNFYTYRVAPEK